MENGDIVSEIVVDGRSVPTSVFWDGAIIRDDSEAWPDFMAWWGDPQRGNFGNEPERDRSNYPQDFNVRLDKLADNLAKNLGQQIASLPDVHRDEHGALIWKDSDGAPYATTVSPQTADHRIDMSSLMSQISPGGKIVGVIHNHTTEFNAGSNQYPNWQPTRNGEALSSFDFDRLFDYSSGINGYDGPNFRYYLVYDGAVSKYYAFEQDRSYYGAGGQATWAIPSPDYALNTA